MTFTKLGYFPVVIAVLMPFTFILTYIIAVLLGHCEPDFPYISDTGTFSPESCIFGQLMNIEAVLLGFVMYIHYRQINEYYCNYSHDTLVLRLNKVGVVLGWLACLGISIVGNFQETNVFAVHVTGAFMVFGFGTIYCWIQVISTYHTQPLMNTIFVAHLRLVLALTCSVFFVSVTVTGSIAHAQFHGKNPTKWYPKDGGWEYHVASTASEWIMAGAFDVFMLTYYQEFGKITLEPPQMYLNIDRLGLPVSGEGVIGENEVTQDETDQIVGRGTVIT